MKDITLEMFKQRTLDILRSRKIFISSGVTNNITIAYQLYRDMLLEDDLVNIIPEKVNAIEHGLVPDSSFKFTRLLCKECGAEMYLRAIYLPVGPSNLKGWKSCWECSRCLHEEYSLKTVLEWKEELVEKIG